jgi:hypothetical protein
MNIRRRESVGPISFGISRKTRWEKIKELEIEI